MPKEGKDRLECGSYRPISILKVDFHIYTSTPIDNLGNILIESTFKVWKKLLKTYHLIKDMNILSWSAYDQNSIPNSTDSRFKIWKTKGIKVFFQIVNDNLLDSFDTLQHNFDLEKEDFYQYLQIWHYYNQYIKQNVSHHFTN